MVEVLLVFWKFVKLRAHLETVLVLILVAFAVRSMVLLGSIIGPRFVFSSKK